jgi:hypothetical protein
VIAVLDRTFNGATVRQRAEDSYMNATAMCKANGKLWADYQRLSSTSAYLAELSADMGIPISELVQVRKGGEPELQGTWVHPDVAIHLAQWCSPKFAVQVSKWVRELLTKGTVAIREEEIDELDLLARQVNQLVQLRKAQRETERRLGSVEVRADDAHRIARAALDQRENRHGYVTILGYCRLTGRSLTEVEAAQIGKRASAILRARNIPRGEQRSERYGQVCSYPETVLAEVFGDTLPLPSLN